MTFGTHVSGEQAEFFAKLHRLRAPLGAKFVEGTAAMCFHRILAYEQLSGDFAIAHSQGNQFQNFKFAPRDVEFFALLLVWQKRVR